jgi:cytochrome c oxidase subunit IV
MSNNERKSASVRLPVEFHPSLATKALSFVFCVPICVLFVAGFVFLGARGWSLVPILLLAGGGLLIPFFVFRAYVRFDSLGVTHRYVLTQVFPWSELEAWTQWEGMVIHISAQKMDALYKLIHCVLTKPIMRKSMLSSRKIWDPRLVVQMR